MPKHIHGFTTHKTRSPEYRAYEDARRRCKNPNRKDWRNYGGRGIEFRFASFVDFIKEIGIRPSNNHSLDRINNNGHYEIGNIRWATPSEQQSNRRTWHVKAA
jgi:hypothetical protein